MTKPCSRCQTEATLKEGVGKTGKPWKGWFCPTEGCGVDWERVQSTSQGTQIRKDENHALLMDANRKLYVRLEEMEKNLTGQIDFVMNEILKINKP